MAIGKLCVVELGTCFAICVLLIGISTTNVEKKNFLGKTIKFWIDKKCKIPSAPLYINETLQGYLKQCNETDVVPQLCRLYIEESKFLCEKKVNIAKQPIFNVTHMCDLGLTALLMKDTPQPVNKQLANETTCKALCNSVKNKPLCLALSNLTYIHALAIKNGSIKAENKTMKILVAMLKVMPITKDSAGATSKPVEPKTTTPKPEKPKTTTPKPEKPKTTTPKPEKPKTTTPKPEKPKTTTPKPEKPKTTTPKPEKPKTTTPKAEKPKTTTPKPEKLKTTTPKPEKLKPEEHEIENPEGDEGSDGNTLLRDPGYQNKTSTRSHFLAWFFTLTVLAIVAYVLFHNKQKIIAFVVEGKQNGRKRRPNTNDYHKLESNVDEVMKSDNDKHLTTQNYIY